MSLKAPGWEYLVVQFKGSIWGGSTGEWDRPELEGFSTEQTLNHFGTQGWELVSLGPVHGETTAVAYMFKRPMLTQQ